MIDKQSELQKEIMNFLFLKCETNDEQSAAIDLFNIEYMDAIDLLILAKQIFKRPLDVQTQQKVCKLLEIHGSNNTISCKEFQTLYVKNTRFELLLQNQSFCKTEFESALDISEFIEYLEKSDLIFLVGNCDTYKDRQIELLTVYFL